MGILIWICFGIFAGSIAGYVLPGRAPGGMGATTTLGIGGALIGGTIGTFLGIRVVNEFDVGAMAMAVAGAILALFIFRLYLDRLKY